jgi:hypothetical protein
MGNAGRIYRTMCNSRAPRRFDDLSVLDVVGIGERTATLASWACQQQKSTV